MPSSASDTADRRTFSWLVRCPGRDVAVKVFRGYSLADSQRNRIDAETKACESSSFPMSSPSSTVDGPRAAGSTSFRLRP